MFCRLLNLCLFCSCLLFFVNSLGLALVAQGSSTAAFTNETDRQSLLALKDLISANPFGILSSWNNSLHFCHWEGVTCSRRHQRVTVLNLTSQTLAGSVSPHIGNLTFLKYLSLRNNSFQGPIPQEIGRLSRLQYLILSYNSFQGEFPINITRCSNLIWLYVFGNKLEGKIPTELGSLANLQRFDCWRNQFTGLIPPSLGNLSSLHVLILSLNNLEGKIPIELSLLSKLEVFRMHTNNLSGMFPLPIYNISSIYSFDVTVNQLHGNLPPDLGLTLPNLQELFLGGNKFTGPFPLSIANASKLVFFDISWNNFTGPVSLNLGSLGDLEYLGLQVNQLGTRKPNDLNFLYSLINCTKLDSLILTENGFGGVLHNSVIGNLSSNLILLHAGKNYITGTIPSDVGNLVNLDRLALESNMLSGSIPKTIGKLFKLQGLYLSTNNISEEIPSSIGNMTLLSAIELSENMLEGSIPIELGSIQNLQGLYLSKNLLTGEIPDRIIGLSSLTIGLYLDQNYLTGPLPSQVGNLKNLGKLSISENNLTGGIPSTLGSCLVLEFLYMQGNFFEGTIPETFKQLKGIQFLDLSRNNLSGKFPSFLEELQLVQNLNLSQNMFEGEVPIEGVFRNKSAFSIAGNLKLCGGIPSLHLPACPTKVLPKNKHGYFHRKIIPLVIVLPVVLLLTCLSVIVHRIRRSKLQTFSISLLRNQHPKISYAELFQATNGFSSTNLIGQGRYGSVYKGVFNSNGQVVAVKVLNLQQRGAGKSFLAECESLRNTRHRNLVKIITSCSSIDSKGSDFKALVFEFMPNGSLDSWLHPSSSELQNQKKLNLLQMLNIAIDVASALEYLHHNCGTPITHCDLKPSNILLDDELCAYIGDFGLARVLLATTSQSNHPQSSSVGIRGTIGYVAPEYGMGGVASTQGDVYSYGILLLEMLTGKRPTDTIFMDNFSLHNHVKMTLPDQVMEIVDRQIILEEEQGSKRIQDCLASILQVGVLCSAELSSERMDIRDVASELHVIRSVFLGVRERRILS